MSDSTDPSADGGLDPLDLVGALEEAPAEMGRRMGVDAMRVANGELDERAFHEKYESALLAEFGDDYEPAEVMADE
jgi:hypothetical protein